MSPTRCEVQGQRRESWYGCRATHHTWKKKITIFNDLYTNVTWVFVSNDQFVRHLVEAKTKKTLKFYITVPLWEESTADHQWPVDSPHIWSIMWEAFTCIYVIMINIITALTHWGRVTHICVSKLNIIGSDNGLSPGRRQAIIWTNARILIIRNLGTNYSEFLGEIHTFSLKKMHLKMSSGKWRPSCPGLNVLTH